MKQFRIKAQRAADSNDARGTMTFEGDDLIEVVNQAHQEGYPRVIEAQERGVTPWTPVEGVRLAEATP